MLLHFKQRPELLAILENALPAFLYVLPDDIRLTVLRLPSELIREFIKLRSVAHKVRVGIKVLQPKQLVPL
ncbi:hypothetical protein D3C87_1860190 [compost metagenome]